MGRQLAFINHLCFHIHWFINPHQKKGVVIGLIVIVQPWRQMIQGHISFINSEFSMCFYHHL